MTRPNVLLIYTDQQRADALGAAGNDQIHTPHLDDLTARGTRFANHFVQNPLCMPSRISMLTGRYPSSLGITHMGVPVPEDTATLATHLGRVGYHCANIGKLHFLPHANREHRDLHPAYDFDHLQISEEPGVYEDAYWSWLRERAPTPASRPSAPLPPARAIWHELMGATTTDIEPRDDYAEIIPFALDEELTHSAFVADETIEYLSTRRGGAPFFCIAGFFSPHAPYIVPPSFIDLYDDRLEPPEADTCGDQAEDLARCRTATHGYYAAVSEVDHHVGRILSALDANGQRDDTIVIFTSDHGDWLGNQGRYAKGYPGDDPVTHVPFVMTGPQIATGRTVDDISEAVDLVPTILEACAVPVPPAVQGRSLLDSLRATASTRSTRSALTEGAGWKSLRTASHRLLVHDDGTIQVTEAATGNDASGDESLVADLTEALLVRLLENERPLPRTYPY
ncbi:MAG: sulfatase-like hydrolase/transferase [Ilumatobacter sp.]|uniref:sulfatase family protein n=1 Tax=Ilumatobacter sp. TaxID=1967498 RepID=UPI003C707488